MYCILYLIVIVNCYSAKNNCYVFFNIFWDSSHNAGFKIAAGCRLQPAFSGHLPAIFKQERQCFFRISVIDSEQETIYSVEDDPFDCGMRSSSEAESD